MTINWIRFLLAAALVSQAPTGFASADVFMANDRSSNKTGTQGVVGNPNCPPPTINGITPKNWSCKTGSQSVVVGQSPTVVGIIAQNIYAGVSKSDNFNAGYVAPPGYYDSGAYDSVARSPRQYSARATSSPAVPKRASAARVALKQILMGTGQILWPATGEPLPFDVTVSNPDAAAVGVPATTSVTLKPNAVVRKKNGQPVIVKFTGQLTPNKDYFMMSQVSVMFGQGANRVTRDYPVANEFVSLTRKTILTKLPRG